MSRFLAFRNRWMRLVVPCLLATGLLSACSGGSSQQYAASTSNGSSGGTGGIGFSLVWQQRTTTKVKAMRTPAFNACVDNAIGTITATVSNGTTTVASASFSCAAHQGVIYNVPAGTSMTVQVDGISSGGTPTTTWSGQISPVTVTTGQVIDAGTIVMTYVGADTTPPTVLSMGPNSSLTSTTNIPVSDRFTIIFDEAMAISTVTSTNITLVDTGTASPVPGIVNYVDATNTASFTPSANLTPNTTYALQVAACVSGSCIKDVSGNQLASDYTNTITTEAAASGIPAAPTGVTTAAGNGQVTLDWPAVAGATSYNIYYGTSSGVTPSTGTKVPGLVAPALHLGLNNGSTYYYVVTAVNSFGESPASAEVSATPALPGGNPLPPNPVTVTPSTGQNTISWFAVTGATSYNIYWSTKPIYPDKYSADNVIRGVTSPYTHSGLSSSQDYCYIVTALNANGESADSVQSCVGLGSIQLFW